MKLTEHVLGGLVYTYVGPNALLLCRLLILRLVLGVVQIHHGHHGFWRQREVVNIGFLVGFEFRKELMVERGNEAPFHVVGMTHEELVQCRVHELFLGLVARLDSVGARRLDLNVDEDVAVEDVEYLLEGRNVNKLILPKLLKVKHTCITVSKGDTLAD